MSWMRSAGFALYAGGAKLGPGCMRIVHNIDSCASAFFAAHRGGPDTRRVPLPGGHGGIEALGRVNATLAQSQGKRRTAPDKMSKMSVSMLLFGDSNAFACTPRATLHRVADQHSERWAAVLIRDLHAWGHLQLHVPDRDCASLPGQGGLMGFVWAPFELHCAPEEALAHAIAKEHGEVPGGVYLVADVEGVGAIDLGWTVFMDDACNTVAVPEATKVQGVSERE